MSEASAFEGLATPGDGLPAPQFKQVFRRHPGGVCVITAAGTDRLTGITATSVISVSAEPAKLAFSIHAGSSSLPVLEQAETVVVNFLAHHQAELAIRFATGGIDRFAAGGWERLPSGEPVLSEVAGWVRARIETVVPVGGSKFVVLHALSAYTRDVAPLVYHDRAYHQLQPILRPTTSADDAR